MTRTWVLVFILLLIPLVAWGQTVSPQDGMLFPRIIGGMNIGGGRVPPCAQVTVTGTLINPLGPGDWIEVNVNPMCAPAICPCAGWMFTAPVVGGPPFGSATVNCMFGGCCSGAVPFTAWIVVQPAGVIIRTYNDAVSADWDGFACNAMVGLPDFMYFANAYMSGLGGCSDYSGDGRTSLADFMCFASNWGKVCP